MMINHIYVSSLYLLNYSYLKMYKVVSIRVSRLSTISLVEIFEKIYSKWDKTGFTNKMHATPNPKNFTKQVFKEDCNQKVSLN